MEWGYFLCISIIFATAIIVPIVSIVFTNIMRRKNEGEAFEVKLNDVTRVPFGLHDTLFKKNKRQHLIDDCDIELVHCCKNDDIIVRVDGASAKRVWKAGRELRMAGGFFPENVLCNENGVCAETEKKIRERYRVPDQKPKPTPHSPKRTVHNGESFFRSIGEAAIDKSMSNRTAHNLKRVLERDSIIGYRGVVSKMLRDRQCLDSINGRADISKTTRGEQKTEDDKLVDVGGVPVPFSTIKTMKVENGELVEVEIKCGNDYNYSNETIEPNRKRRNDGIKNNVD